MSQPEPVPLIGWICFSVFFSVWFWNAYLMIAHPRRWVELFHAKLWKLWGVALTVVDEQKLRRKAWLIGALLLIVGAMMVPIYIIGLRR